MRCETPSRARRSALYRAGPSASTTTMRGEETPDGFLAGIYDEAPDLVIGSLANARRNLNKSGSSAQDFLELLGRQGFTKLMRRLRSHASAL